MLKNIKKYIPIKSSDDTLVNIKNLIDKILNKIKGQNDNKIKEGDENDNKIKEEKSEKI